MILSLVAMIGLKKCYITSACLQGLCHSGERAMARGLLVSHLSYSSFVLHCLWEMSWNDWNTLDRMSGLIVYLLEHITKTCLYNFDPLKPHFCIVKLGFTGVYIIFLISAQKHRLWVLVRTAFERVPTIYVLSRNMKNIEIFYLKIFIFRW